MSSSLLQYVLTAALRDKLVVSLILLLLVGTSLSVFMGSAAIVEKDQFSVVFAGGGLRLAGILGLVLFVVFFMRRSFDSKEIEFLLSRPIGRIEFLVSYAAAFSILAIILGIAQGVCIYILGHQFFGEGHLLWITSIIIENIVMVNVALFFAMIMSSAATAALASFGFYTLCRMMGQILGIIDTKKASDLPFNDFMEILMQVISSVLPRLDLLGQTSWLIYGAEGVAAGFMLLQSGVFIVFVLLAALLDLVRRQF